MSFMNPNYPNMELLEYKARQLLGQNKEIVEKVKELRKENRYAVIDFESIVFPQVWGSTCTGFDVMISIHAPAKGATEDELQELTIKAEEHIESIKKSELRIMFRFYFLDGENYAKTAMRMNCMFPGRKIPYTDENVKKRIQRYFENVPHCPEEKV